MTAVALDAMDVVAVEMAAQAAIDAIRGGNGPQFLECRTYRLRAHSMFDAQLYRDKAEVEEWRARGPLITFTQRCKAAGLITEEDFLRLQKEADAEVDAAVAFAESSGWEPVEELGRWVYAEPRA
jgi:TPP-dependent pyruvate/acetoin dehydrogenase alpha subunit